MARKKSTPVGVRHVVMRYNWRPAGPAGWDHVPGMIPISYHNDAGSAEADRAARVARVRRLVNPFSCKRLGLLSSLPLDIFFDLLADRGIAPPEPRDEDAHWVKWWDGVPMHARPAIWDALDRLRFYEVAERPACPIGYALVTINWQLDLDDNPYLNDEGGTVRGIYRTREAAHEEGLKLARNFSGSRDYWFPTSVDPLDPEAVWRVVNRSLGGRGSKFNRWPTGHDVVEVELHGLENARKGQPVSLVIRRTWNSCASEHNDDDRAPVSAYADHDAALARCRELEDEVRRNFDVFPIFGANWGRAQCDAFFETTARLGLPPAKKPREGWWSRHLPVLTLEQRVELWEAVAAAPYDEENLEEGIWVYEVGESAMLE